MTPESGVPPEPGTTPEPAATPAPEVTTGPAVPGWRGRLGVLRRPRVAVPAAIAVVVIVALAVAGATVGTGAAAPHSLGKAKNFTLGVLGHPGRQLSLQSMANRPVIVNFFASWCEPCQRETPLIARFYRSHQRSVIIIGIDVNDTSSAGLAFARKMGVGYPVASDPAPMTMALSYGVSALPQTFFLNAQHRIVKRVIREVTLTDLRRGVAIMTKQSARS